MPIVVLSCVDRFHVRAGREEMVGDHNVGDACELPVMQLSLVGGRFAMWAGDECMEKFVEMVLSCLPVVMRVLLDFALQ